MTEEPAFYRVSFPLDQPSKSPHRVPLAGLFRALLALVVGAVVDLRAATPPPVDSFVRLSEDEGLAHSDVRAIVQDHAGFMWMGLRLAGLARYDGYELKVYQHDPQNPRTLGSRVIWFLFVDRGGTLWVGTEGGLDRFDRSTDSFIHYRHDPARNDSLPNNVVTCIGEDSTGRIWVGTREGLARLDDRERGTFTTFRRPQVIEGSTTKDTYRTITEDPKTGLFWLGATDGLAAFDPRTGAFASFLHDPEDPQSLSHNAVNKVVIDEQGVFWALTELGVNSFVPALDRVETHTVQQPRTTFTRFLPAKGATNPGANIVRSGMLDRKGRLWLATRGGLHLMDRSTGTFTNYVRKPGDVTSLSDTFTHTVFEDRTGNLWVGTYAGGVSRLRSESKPFLVHRYEPGNPRSLSDDRVVGLAFDPAGVLWAATVNGLNRYDGKEWTRFLHDPTDPHSLPSNDLTTVATAPNGDVWVGATAAGVYRFDQKRFHTFPASPSNAPAPNGWHPFTGTQVNSILPDANGGVWIGARPYGLDYFFNGQFLHYNPQEATADSPAQPTVQPVLGVLAPDGACWFAAEASGLVRFDPQTKRFTSFQPPMLPHGTLRSLQCIAAGNDGIVWLGGPDGLLKFNLNTRQFEEHYTTAQGLSNDAILGIVVDRRGHLWLGTRAGLSHFDPVTRKFRTYEKYDGLPSGVFAQRTAALGPDGRVYLGTRAGIVSFMPEELRDNPNPPPVALTELRWIGTPPRMDKDGTRPAVVLNIGDEVRVPAGQPGFSFKFSALEFTAPEKNLFRYRLEGWETEWTPASVRERIATYTALPPGEYVFRVQASNADEVWNERGASVRVIVEPHFWQTLWFRLGGGVMAAGLLTAVIQRRLRGVRRQNALLEKQVSARTIELQTEVAVRHAAEAALRESHTELENRVDARTAELAHTNLSLQTEIAERKNIESQLRQSQKMEAVGQLAGGIAHDFNNLLTVILGQSELLTDTGMPPDARDSAVSDIKAAAERATNLTRQLLVFSRHQEVSAIAIDLNTVVSGVSTLLRHVIGEHITLGTTLTAQPLGVLGDPGMLEQVLLNMAVNARDAMPRGGHLSIGTARITVSADHAHRTPHAKAGDYARFTVSDQGEGIPEKIRPQIFEPFFTTKEAGKGTGLGLAISLGIVHQHHGWIDVESREGEGSTFHVYLPLQPTVGQPPAAVARPLPVAAGNTTVLVAEDESAVRNVVQRVLTRQGYRVIECVSGGDALARWAECRDEVSILLTDIVMPGWPDGHELAARLLEEKPSLRVVTMSGYDPGEFAAVAAGGPVRPHLRKPFTTDDLLRALASTAES